MCDCIGITDLRVKLIFYLFATLAFIIKVYMPTEQAIEDIFKVSLTSSAAENSCKKPMAPDLNVIR